MVKVIPWSPFSIAGLRSGIALLILILLNRSIKIQFNKSTIFGGLSYASMVVFFVIANKITTAGLTAITCSGCAPRSNTHNSPQWSPGSTK